MDSHRSGGRLWMYGYDVKTKAKIQQQKPPLCSRQTIPSEFLDGLGSYGSTNAYPVHNRGVATIVTQPKSVHTISSGHVHPLHSVVQQQRHGRRQLLSVTFDEHSDASSATLQQPLMPPVQDSPTKSKYREFEECINKEVAALNQEVLRFQAIIKAKETPVAKSTPDETIHTNGLRPVDGKSDSPNISQGRQQENHLLPNQNGCAKAHRKNNDDKESKRDEVEEEEEEDLEKTKLLSHAQSDEEGKSSFTVTAEVESQQEATDNKQEAATAPLETYSNSENNSPVTTTSSETSLQVDNLEPKKKTGQKLQLLARNDSFNIAIQEDNQINPSNDLPSPSTSDISSIGSEGLETEHLSDKYGWFESGRLQESLDLDEYRATRRLSTLPEENENDNDVSESSASAAPKLANPSNLFLTKTIPVRTRSVEKPSQPTEVSSLQSRSMDRIALTDSNSSLSLSLGSPAKLPKSTSSSDKKDDNNKKEHRRASEPITEANDEEGQGNTNKSSWVESDDISTLACSHDNPILKTMNKETDDPQELSEPTVVQSASSSSEAEAIATAERSVEGSSVEEDDEGSIKFMDDVDSLSSEDQESIPTIPDRPNSPLRLDESLPLGAGNKHCDKGNLYQRSVAFDLSDDDKDLDRKLLEVELSGDTLAEGVDDTSVNSQEIFIASENSGQDGKKLCPLPSIAEEHSQKASKELVGILKVPAPDARLKSFPSLPETFLQRLCLHRNQQGNGSLRTDNLTDQDVENKFTSLSLAFKTDKLTLTNRLELQLRQRDIAEKNIEEEIDQLKKAVESLSRVCQDAETREVLKRVQQQVEVVHQSAERVSSSAEVHGAVQQEARIARAIEIMLMHVDNLKRIYEREHIELEESRKILADHHLSVDERGNGLAASSASSGLLESNGRPNSRGRSVSVMHHNASSASNSSNLGVSLDSPKLRRASIATQPQSRASSNPANRTNNATRNPTITVNKANRKLGLATNQLGGTNTSSGSRLLASLSEVPSISSLAQQSQRPNEKESEESLEENNNQKEREGTSVLPSGDAKPPVQATRPKMRSRSLIEPVKEEDENFLLDEIDQLARKRDSSPAPPSLRHSLEVVRKARSLYQKLLEWYQDLYWPWDWEETLLGLRYCATGLLLLAAFLSLILTFLDINGSQKQTEEL